MAYQALTKAEMLYEISKRTLTKAENLSIEIAVEIGFSILSPWENQSRIYYFKDGSRLIFPANRNAKVVKF